MGTASKTEQKLELDKAIGERLRFIRFQINESKVKFSKRLHMSPEVYGRKEAGNSVVTARDLYHLSHSLPINLSHLLREIGR